MPLFCDGPPSSIEDLTNQDSGLLDVCRVEQINASVKLNLAHEELGLELSSLFEQQRSNSFRGQGEPKLHLTNVAVTAALRLWHTWLTLALIYRDAYFNQLNDRYKSKWDEYIKLARSAEWKLRELGIGLVQDPLPRPDGPTITGVPATEHGGTFYFAVTLVNAAGEESTNSEPESYTAPDGSVAGLQIVSAPKNALGWNVYAGTTPDGMYLQNESPLAVNQDWTYNPSTALTAGDTPGNGQTVNFLRELPRLLQRG